MREKLDSDREEADKFIKLLEAIPKKTFAELKDGEYHIVEYWECKDVLNTLKGGGDHLKMPNKD